MSKRPIKWAQSYEMAGCKGEGGSEENKLPTALQKNSVFCELSKILAYSGCL